MLPDRTANVNVTGLADLSVPPREERPPPKQQVVVDQTRNGEKYLAPGRVTDLSESYRATSYYRSNGLHQISTGC